MAGEYIPALRFDRLTPLFDGVVAVASRDRTLKRAVLDRAAPSGGEAVLDVGCGTGTLAVAAARRGARVTGLDADPAILSRARRKASAAGVDVAFAEGMSTDVPHPDASFDVVVSTLFFHHLRDDAKRATAAELARVLRPGGRLVIGDWGRSQDPLMRLGVLSVQLLDGFATTSLNVRGELPRVLALAGFENVAVRERIRTPTGSFDVMTARAA